MNQGMQYLAQSPSTMPMIRFPQAYPKSLNKLKASKVMHVLVFSRIHLRKHHPVYCTKLSRWEPSPVTYAPTENSGDNFLDKPPDIFETSEKSREEPVTTENSGDNFLEKPPDIFETSEKSREEPVTNSEELAEISGGPVAKFQFLKWPLWVLGPSLLLTTGMIPTLWLPISSIFLGPNIVSLLSLVGLDCLFNLGTILFLLMADSCARSKLLGQSCNSKPPFSYKFWNMVATLTGLVTPLIMLFGSQKGFLQPQLPFISFAVLLGPYLLLLSVQILTEMLTWHWQSPVWLVTPVVYEAYRLLQLMRGLKLGAEVSAPGWMLDTLKGLVCWWVFILGVQLMRVAWFAGFSARTNQQQSPASADA